MMHQNLRFLPVQAITEGDGNTADFTITSNVNVSSLTVFYTPTSSNFLQSGSGVKISSLINFSGDGPYTAPLRIVVHNDSTSESNGPISVTLNEESTPATSYTVATSPNNTASVQVMDDDSLPLLTITPPMTPIAESAGSIDFVVASTTNLGSNFRFRYDPSEVDTGDFLNNDASPTSQEAIKSTNLNFTGTTGYYTTTLNVPIHNDDVGERTGQIAVELLGDDATLKTYRVATDGSQVAKVTILDDDAPELKITGGIAVTEGDGNTAGFTVSSAVSLTALTVYYTPESANFMQTGSGIETFTTLNFTGNGPYTAPLAITVHDDETRERSGVIRVTLNEESTPATNYTIAASPNNTATVSVTDDDSLPLLTIASPTTPVAESDGSIDFVITTTSNLGADFRVRYNPSEQGSGNFLDENTTPLSQEAITTQLIDFTESNQIYTATLSVPIHNDSVGERTGQIDVELLSENTVPKTYRVATNGSQIATATILDDDAPELKITAGSSVVEGDGNSANFTITSEVSVNALTIYYTPESASFMESGSGTETFATLSFTGDGPYTAQLPIRVHNDETIETNGSISVTLNEENVPATNYTVADSPNNSARVSVFDNDSPPRVVIATDSGTAMENTGTARFKLSATGIFTDSTLMINATPNEDGGDFLTDTVAGTTADFPVQFSDSDGDRIYTGELSVNLHNDLIREATGNIKLRLNAKPPTYLLGSSVEGTITVLDDDAPELKVRTGGPIVEGLNVTADFIISAEISPNKMITLRYDLVESHNFISIEGTGKTEQLDFRNGAKEATLSVNIANDNAREDNGTISVTLLADNADPITYTVAASPNNSAVKTVIDDDSLPTISIMSDSGSVSEGVGIARFKFEAFGLTETTTVVINATPVENGSDFLTNAIADTTVNYSVEFSDPDGNGTYIGEIPISLDNDTVGEATGSIALRLNESLTAYRRGSYQSWQGHNY